MKDRLCYAYSRETQRAIKNKRQRWTWMNLNWACCKRMTLKAVNELEASKPRRSTRRTRARYSCYAVPHDVLVVWNRTENVQPVYFLTGWIICDWDSFSLFSYCKIERTQNRRSGLNRSSRLLTLLAPSLSALATKWSNAVRDCYCSIIFFFVMGIDRASHLF